MMATVRMLTLMSFVGLVAAVSPSPAGPTLKEWKDAKDEVAAEAKAVIAKEKKMAAVQKVIALLEGLKNKVLQEGEAEAQTYNKFSCFCKDTTVAKTHAISTGEDEKATLSASIETYNGERDVLDQNIQTFLEEIAHTEKYMKAAKAERAATLATYEKNDADLRAAIAALEGAIASLKSSKAPSFAQFQAVADTVSVAVTLADALGLNKGSEASLLSLKADPEVAMEDYKFHSDDIIATLEKLMKDFTTEKTDVDAAEVESVKEFDALMQQQTDRIKAKAKALEDSKKAKATKIEEIAMASSELTTVAATLLDDQQYLRELSEMCSDKATTWDQRTQVRQDELSALTAAIGVITSTVSEKTTAATVRLAQQVASVKLAEAGATNQRFMEEIEAEAEAADSADSNGPASFLQHASTRSASFLTKYRNPAVVAHGSRTVAGDVRRTLADMFKGEGQLLKSALLTSLASHVAEDPFAKVKTLIQELIERLLTEAAHDSNQKDWCDKSISDAEQKRDYAEEAVEKHNAAMAVLEANRDKLNEDLGVLGEAITAITDSRAKAVALRAADKAENDVTVTEATEGLGAVEEAITILDQFYKTVAKEKVFTLAQRGPAEDAADAGFEIGEAYIGAQGVAGGILGMMDVIMSDFQRTIAETQKAEVEAQEDHLKFMTESGKSLKQKEVAETEKTKQLDAVKEKLADEEEGLSDQMVILTTAVKELMELKPACIDTGMNYADRVSRRKEEIEALKKGLCILDHYSEYGAESAADTC